MKRIRNQFVALGLAASVTISTYGFSAVQGRHVTKQPAKSLVNLDKSPTLAQLDQRLAERPITLKEAVTVALAVNPTLDQAGETLAFAQGRVKEARSAFMPNISVQAGEQFISHLATPLYVVQATMPLDISRLISAATQQAGFQEVQARLDVNRVRNDIVYRVESAFYATLRAKALQSVAEENLSNSKERLRDAQARYRARAVAYIDVSRAETDVAEAQKELIQARSNVDGALALLANAMGIAVTTPLQISDENAVVNPPGAPNVITGHIPTPDEMPAPAIPAPLAGDAFDPKAPVVAKSSNLGPAFQADLGEALHSRPEVLEADAGISAAQKGVILARRSELPSLAMGLGYFELRSISGSPVNEPQAFIGINIPIYDGGLAKARVQEAKATVQAAITSKRQAIDSITLDVQQAYLAEIEATDEVTAAGQALVEARVAYDLALVRYNTGVASHAGISPLIEVSDAQAALTLAEQNQVNALYDYNGARAQVSRSEGRFAYLDQASNTMPAGGNGNP